MAQQRDHSAAMLLVARAQKKAQAERKAAVEELEVWFQKEIAEIRAEIAAGRRELRSARLELARWKQITDARNVARDDAVPLH
jgi:hypothetical protein